MKRIMKTIARFALLAIILGSGACADQYADYRGVLENERALLGEFIAEARQAIKPDALAADIEKLSAGLRDLADKMNRAERAHPELGGENGPADAPEIPRELQDDLKALERSVADLDKLLLEKEKLFSDPKVEKALKDLLDLRGSLGL